METSPDISFIQIHLRKDMTLDWVHSEKYVSLETYRRNGAAVRTPVWFVAAGDKGEEEGILIVTREKTGKVRRLRGNSQVRIAPCTIKGTVTGDWVTGTAEILDDARTSEAVRLRDKRYGFRARLAKVLSKGKGDPVALLVKAC